MELIEIKGLFKMEDGYPSPIIITNENGLFIAFYIDKETDFESTKGHDFIYDVSICVLKFNSCIKYIFGIPGNETINGHPYYGIGMRSFAFYELRNSDLIQNLEDIQRVHPRYIPGKFSAFKHYILTFHDNMFECVARGFELKEAKSSIFNDIDLSLNNLFIE